MSSPDAAAAPPAPTSNKRPSSSEPEDRKADTKRSKDEDDITADDEQIERPAQTGDDVNMEENANKEAAATTTTTTTAATTEPVLPPAPNANSSPETPASVPAAPEPVPQQIQMRCLIVTQDASVIIGKAGKHVNEIREKSGARVTVSESIPGNPERILNVSGALDAVSKAFGLIVRRINDEPFDVASVPGSRAVTIKFIIPNSRMGTIIGKGGSKIKEIQEASGARLNASEAMLPGSTERVLSVSGVADAIHIAVYYIGNILLEYQDRPAGRADSSSYRQAGVGSAPRADRYEPRGDRAAPVNAALAGPGVQTQTIYIPNDLVGSIIGKAGAKINEIRATSGTQIRIMEPGQPGASTDTNERLVTITGQPAAINMAVQLLYQRLEIEKAARLQAQAV